VAAVEAADLIGATPQRPFAIVVPVAFALPAAASTLLVLLLGRRTVQVLGRGAHLEMGPELRGRNRRVGEATGQRARPSLRRSALGELMKNFEVGKHSRDAANKIVASHTAVEEAVTVKEPLGIFACKVISNFDVVLRRRRKVPLLSSSLTWEAKADNSLAPTFW